jgi:hypothetical protein
VALIAAAWAFLVPGVLVFAWGWSGYLGLSGWLGFFLAFVILSALTMALIAPLWRWAKNSN